MEFCFHESKLNLWHLELYFHHEFGNFPKLIINFHIKLEREKNLYIDDYFLEIMKEKLTDNLISGMDIIDYHFDELIQVNLINPSEYGFRLIKNKAVNDRFFLPKPYLLSNPLKVIERKDTDIIHEMIKKSQDEFQKKVLLLDIVLKNKTSPEKNLLIKNITQEIVELTNQIECYKKTIEFLEKTETYPQNKNPDCISLNHQNFSPPEKNEIRLLGFDYQEAPKDGHCFYHAVSYYAEKSVNHLRKITADFLKENQADFQDFFSDTSMTYEEFIFKVEHQALWADDLEIQALSLALNRPIIVINPDGKTYKEDAFLNFNEQIFPIFVYFDKNEKHYDALLFNGSYSLEFIKNKLQKHESLLTIDENFDTNNEASQPIERIRFTW